MSTAQELINNAALSAEVLATGQQLEAAVNTIALRKLNRMLSRWKNNGVNLGLPTLTASDTVIVDDSDEEAIEIQLQLRLMIEYGKPISAGLSKAGDDAFTELQAKYSIVEEMQLDKAMTRKNAFTFQLGV